MFRLDFVSSLLMLKTLTNGDRKTSLSCQSFTAVDTTPKIDDRSSVFRNVLASKPDRKQNGGNPEDETLQFEFTHRFDILCHLRVYLQNALKNQKIKFVS